MNAAPFTVLVVCTGNVNRSALGAALLRTWSGWYLPDATAGAVRVVSAGLRAPTGSRMGRRSRAIADALGADGSGHRAQQITEASVRSADLVLVSSADQRDAVLGLVPAALHATFTIREAGRIAADLPDLPRAVSADDLRGRVASLAQNRSVVVGVVGDDDIIDPQGRDDEAYRLMARQEVPPLARLAHLLFDMPAAEIVAYDRAVEAGAFGLTVEPASGQSDEPDVRSGRHET